MFYDEEELLEAVEILMEDYDLTEDEAIEIVLESYEDDFDDYELDELSEAVEILMEDYDLDEDEAIDLLFNEGESHTKEEWDAIYKAQRKADRDETMDALGTIGGIAGLTFAGRKMYNDYMEKQRPINKLKRKIGKTRSGIKNSVKKARKRRLRKARVKKVKKALHLK